jgi:hypothetical protein
MLKTAAGWQEALAMGLMRIVSLKNSRSGLSTVFRVVVVLFVSIIMRTPW